MRAMDILRGDVAAVEPVSFGVVVGVEQTTFFDVELESAEIRGGGGVEIEANGGHFLLLPLVPGGAGGSVIATVIPLYLT
ncbi:hypothetical protein RZS08_23840 [Arthrospira platensis SPKY1]|nr:hypothetical protein [Arthrospira platensis SPKY1]